MEFGNKLRTLRKAKGLSQENLAKQLGISRQAISKWESNLSQPDIDNIIQLCKIFQISADELLGVDVTSEISSAHSKNLAYNTDLNKYKRGTIICFIFSFFIIMFVYILTICKPELKVGSNYEILHLWNLAFWLQNNLLPLGIFALIGIVSGIILIFKYISA